MNTLTVSRLNAAVAPIGMKASSIAPSFTRSCGNHSSRTRPSTSMSNPQCIPSQKLSRSYATITKQQHSTSYLTIPYPSTSAHLTHPINPPTRSQIRSHLPHPQNPSTPKLHVGTVTRTGTMSKTVQITFNTQRFDAWLKRRTQHPTRILVHEPTGYLRVGDVVEFARFTPATMAERYESGMLNRRGGGVRWEVHRVVTPFGKRVEDRAELEGKGELWERLGDVEFERRKAELGKPWNKNVKRRVRILEGMFEALGMEAERTRLEMGLTLDKVEGLEQPPQQSSCGGRTIPGEEFSEEMSEAQKDIAKELQKLQGGQQSA